MISAEPKQQAAEVSQKKVAQNSGGSAHTWIDQRPQATSLRQLQEVANNNEQSRQLQSFQHRAQTSARSLQLNAIGATKNAHALPMIGQQEQDRSHGPSTAQVVQAVLDTVAKEATKADLTVAIDNVQAEIFRQKGLSESDGRLVPISAGFAELKAAFEAQDLATSIRKLNGLVLKLNSNAAILLAGAPAASASDKPKSATSSSSTVAASSSPFASAAAYPSSSSSLMDMVPDERALTSAQMQSHALWRVAKDLGIFDSPDVHFWVNPAYLAKRGAAGIPSKLLGVITELVAKNVVEGADEDAIVEGDIEVLTSIKIFNPHVMSSTGESLLVREIDMLEVVARGDGMLLPFRLIEVKTSLKKPKSLKTDMDAKVKALREARASNFIIRHGRDDITNSLVFNHPDLPLVAQSAGPGSDYDIRLQPELSEKLANYIQTYRFALSKLLW